MVIATNGPVGNKFCGVEFLIDRRRHAGIDVNWSVLYQGKEGYQDRGIGMAN